jgi:uncharacterized protein YutE (UPF0331/DUF86 family)
MNEIVLNKAEIIERACNRAVSTYAAHRTDLEANLDAQDVIVLNLQRACEAAIDLAMHVVRLKQLGLPKESREAYSLLQASDIIDPRLSDRLQKMVAFRNIAVHDYRTIDWSIVRSILEHDIADLRGFSQHIVQRFG